LGKGCSEANRTMFKNNWSSMNFSFKCLKYVKIDDLWVWLLMVTIF
jgi:hypothetical protein